MSPKRPPQPFPGLRSFEPDEDSPVLRPRAAAIDDLLGRLRRARFLAVVGGSGSGKSSLVKSGLMPSLLSGHVAKAGSSWRVALLRPGGDPIGNLAAARSTIPAVLGGDRAIDELSGAPARRLAASQRSGARRCPCARRASAAGRKRPRRRRSVRGAVPLQAGSRPRPAGRDEAVAFVKLLLEAARQDERSDLRRADDAVRSSSGRARRFPGLAEAVNDGQYLVPRMTRDELRLAITGPVAVGGGQIAPRLVTRRAERRSATTPISCPCCNTR